MAEKNPVVLMSTSKGDIRIELDAENAPITTKNFRRLCERTAITTG